LKIVSLVGSPRGAKGNTARLLKVVLEGAGSAGARTETIFLRGGTVRPCKACNTCHKKGKCAQKDKFESIKHKILQADGLVLASPNYIFNVSAQMKAFMDRCCGVIHCMAFEGKYGASVVTSGGGDQGPIAEYMNHFLITTGIRPVGSVWATMGTIVGDAFPDEIQKQATALGKKLVASWKDKAILPRVESRISAFKDRIRSLMIYREEEWPYEYEYWAKYRGLK
jgi:multimeric flavodoxin WrbA